MKQMKSMVFFVMVLMAVIGFTNSAIGQDTESLVVTETGNVGIGTSTPDKKLEVVGDTKINGDVETTGRIKDKTGFIMPVGTILPFGGTNAPEGWLLCDGTAYSRTIGYADLFAAIGTAFGAPDADTFNVPDLRGQFLRGVDNGAGLDPDVAGRTESKPGGNIGDNVGTKQADEFKKHQHHYYGDDDTVNNGNVTTTGSGLSRNYTYLTDFTGGNETRPVNITVNFIIKY